MYLSKCKTLTGRIGLLLAAMFCSVLAIADDWVLTDRFNAQLKAAQKGDPVAMYEVGRMYERGRGTELNLATAAQWFQKSADLGQNDARARLGILYYDGAGVAKNLPKAIELLSTAAKANVATAQFYLAHIYENGDGLPRDIDKAVQWYQAAANGGYYQAKARLLTLQNTPSTPPRKPVVKQTQQLTKNENKTPPPDVVATPAAKPGELLMTAILQGDWLLENKPASFLPSRTTLCEKTGELSMKCVSGELQRNTGATVISYVLEATLSGFNASDQFAIEYVNNVLGTKNTQSESSSDTARGLGFNVKLGKQSTVHKLNCELEEENKLVCVKDRINTLTFTRK